MLHLIPGVKTLEEKGGFLKERTIRYEGDEYDIRLLQAVEKLPRSKQGTMLSVRLAGGTGEGYEIWIEPESIRIQAESLAGAFYGVQTLRQILKNEQVPCLYIRDWPDFPYRGFYHDATRGKVPTVESVKKLIDQMAYYKMNSLQLYVEHTFEFEECKDLHPHTGCLTASELRELDEYCKGNFIDFVPSLSTFGHSYELLEQEQFQHLRVMPEFPEKYNFWHARMGHHTIDPLHPESIQVIRSLIDQYAPHFTSDIFNICCDETFDLKNYPDPTQDTGRLYVDFVQKIIAHVQSKGKRVMMWADILLQHPETIEELPEDVIFLNWNYRAQPPEEKVAHFASLGRKQIVCPGTTTWSRLCEDVDTEEQNICRMADFGAKYGALGVLNTNWGDWGNPCSVELAMYGLVLGAAKSWTVATKPDEGFYSQVNDLLYGSDAGIRSLKALCDIHSYIKWNHFARCYFAHRFEGKTDVAPFEKDHVSQVQQRYQALVAALQEQVWGDDECRQEMLIAAEGLCLLAELYAKLGGFPVERLTDTEAWIAKYRAKWLAKNKESELRNIEEMLRYCEAI